jgi:type I restriction enzyme S subunit
MSEMTARPWLAALPHGWTVQRIKHVARFAGGGTPSKAVDENWGGHIPWVSPKDMKVFRITETQDYITDAAVRSSACSLIPVGATLMVVRSGILQHTIPVAINDVPVCLNQDMKALLPEEGMLSVYLAYLVQGLNDRFLDEWVKQGATVESIEHESMANTPIPVPPMDRQHAIASYLDAETARIDGLIEEKERLVGALEELRSSVMGEAVQRGLNTGVELIETGVQWLGRAPRHWKVMRLKHLLDGIEQGWSPQCDGRLAEAHEWGVLKAGACNGGTFRAEEHKALQAGMDGDPSIEVQAGDVLMSRASGSLDLVGSVAYIEKVRPKLMLSDKIFRLRLDQSLGTSAQWLAMVFNTPFQRRQIASYVGGAEGLARNITSSAIKELWLAVPPPGEQEAIVEHASARLAQIEDLIRFVNAEVALLQELRSATITDAVLGRIDVREHMKH